MIENLNLNVKQLLALKLFMYMLHADGEQNNPFQPDADEVLDNTLRALTGLHRRRDDEPVYDSLFLTLYGEERTYELLAELNVQLKEMND